MPTDKPMKVFVSYSHKDRRLWDEFRPQLEILQATGLIAAWHDGMIPSGDWDGHIRAELEDASMILLLISASFLTSSYCVTTEAKRAIQRSQEDTAVVIPIILRPCAWNDFEIAGVQLGNLQALPADGRPVTRWGSHDEAFFSISKGIRYAVESRTTSIQVAVHRPPRPEHRERRRLIDVLAAADEAQVIGLTNPSLASFLQQALQIRKDLGLGFWSYLTIVFASPEFLDLLPDEYSETGTVTTAAMRRHVWHQGRRSVYQYLLSLGSQYRNNWSCREYHHAMPFTGVLHTRSDGTLGLRIAHITPGGDMKRALYLEFEAGTPLFEQTAETIRMISSSSRHIVEWNVLAAVENNNILRIEGLVDRKRLDYPQARQIGQTCHPVVLVMLYLQAPGGRLSILQHRSSFNAAENIGKFSNISGWVTDLDLFSALNIEPSAAYFRDNYEQPSTGDNAWQGFLIEVGPSPVLPLEPPSAETSNMWHAAARREILEELGLTIAPNRIQYHGSHRLIRPGAPDLLFGIHSLQLQLLELEEVRTNRPHADLRAFSCHDLHRTRAESGFNDLLQKHFDDVFLGILHELGVCP